MDVSSAIKTSGYNLAPFRDILEDIQTHVGLLDSLAGKHILELGPGRRVDLMRFCTNEIHAAQVTGAGKALLFPWTRHKAFINQQVSNTRLLDFFTKAKPNRYDLIYSRLVFEQHSIDPWVLLRSKDYWNQFKKPNFQDFDENYPASIPNLQSIFRKAYKTLKPGGTIISYIGKRQYSALEQGFLDKLKPKAIHKRNIGTLSSIITVNK